MKRPPRATFIVVYIVLGLEICATAGRAIPILWADSPIVALSVLLWLIFACGCIIAAAINSGREN